MIGAIVKLLGKPLLKFVAKPLMKVVKFAGKSIFGGLLGRGMVGRLLGGVLGKVLGTGLFGGIASILTNTASASGLSEDQLAPQLSQAATKDKIRYYEKQVKDFKPKLGRPKQGEPTNEERLNELNFNLDQAKKELSTKEAAEKQKSFNKNTITDSIGTVLGVLSVVPGLITTSISNLFGSKEEQPQEQPDLPDLNDEGEQEQTQSESSNIGKNIGGIAGGLLGSVFGGPLLGGTLGYFAGNALGGLVDKFIDGNKDNQEVIQQNDVKPVEQEKLTEPVKLNNPTMLAQQPQQFTQVVQQNEVKQPNRIIDKPESTEDQIKKYKALRKQSMTDEEIESRNQRNSIKDHLAKVNDPNRDKSQLIITPIKETVIVQNSSILDKYKTSRG